MSSGEQLLIFVTLSFEDFLNSVAKYCLFDKICSEHEHLRMLQTVKYINHKMLRGLNNLNHTKNVAN